MLLRPCAKINLDLRVGGLRPDGFHEIRTILQTIDWCDELHLAQADRFEFVCRGGPEDESNLVVRAVREFERMTARTVRARIELLKKIPIGAGLGGGSADAAATLLGLARLYDQEIPQLDLLRSLRALGSDVPFFAVGGRAAGTGRGEEVFPLEDDAGYRLLVVCPSLAVTTREAYSWLTAPGESNSIESFCAQFICGCADATPRNDFERVVFNRHPALATIRDDLLQAGASRAALSGSGAAVFGIFEDEQVAAAAASRFGVHGIVKLTKPLPRAEYWRKIFGS